MSAVKSNPKFFYAYTRKKLKTKEGIGPLEEGSSLIDNPQDIANVLSSHFDGVFSTPLAGKQIHLPETFFNERTGLETTLTNVVLTPDDIWKALVLLSPNSAPGPDNVPAILLENCTNELSTPFTILFKKSMINKDIPDLLKKAIRTPMLHKGGS